MSEEFLNNGFLKQRQKQHLCNSANGDQMRFPVELYVYTYCFNPKKISLYQHT